MSKTALKKELDRLDKAQLVELVLDAYSSSKETKAYFEFFLNPDADSLLEKKIDIISKELVRAKRGYSKARISVIRNTIKDFAAYGVGAEYTGRLMHSAIRMIVGMERYYNFGSSLINGTSRLISDYLHMAQKEEILETALANLHEIVESDIGRAAYRQYVGRCVEEVCRDMSVNSLKPIKKSK